MEEKHKSLSSLKKGDLPALPKVPWGRYHHYRDATKIYEVLGVARHTETLEPMVIYKRTDDAPELWEGALWARPYAMFVGKVAVEGSEVDRFVRIG
jgi:hypothetical protein